MAAPTPGAGTVPVVSEYLTTSAWGTPLSTVTADGTTLDAWFPTGHLGLGARPSDEAKMPPLWNQRTPPAKSVT